MRMVGPDQWLKIRRAEVRSARQRQMQVDRIEAETARLSSDDVIGSRALNQSRVEARPRCEDWSRLQALERGPREAWRGLDQASNRGFRALDRGRGEAAHWN